MMGIWTVSRGETSPSSTVPSGKTFLFFFSLNHVIVSSILLYSIIFCSFLFYCILFFSVLFYFFILFLFSSFSVAFVLLCSILFCSFLFYCICFYFIIFSFILLCSVLPYRKFQKLPTSPPHVHFTCTPSTNSPLPGCCCRAATR